MRGGARASAGPASTRVNCRARAGRKLRTGRTILHPLRSAWHPARMTTPLLCIAIALVLAYAPRFAVVAALRKMPGGYDNVNPRAQQDRLTGWGARARAAHNNGLESFAPFAAGVLVAHVTHADPKWSTILALLHVGARALYPALYIAGVGGLRSAVWSIGFGASCGLLCLPLFG